MVKIVNQDIFVCTKVNTNTVIMQYSLMMFGSGYMIDAIVLLPNR